MNSKQNKNNIYVVLGMHKSGTTLVSRLLMDAGVHMGEFDPNWDYDAGNQLEREETRLINKKLLACEDSFSLEVQRPVRLKEITEDDHKKGVMFAKFLCRKHSDWGFKDPRTCLTYDYWEKVLPHHRIIIIYRHPAEVMSHYFHRRFSPTTILRISRGLKCWTQYNRQLLDIIRRRPDALILNFSSLMQDKAELSRLEGFINLPLTDSRNPKKYRSKKKISLYYLTALMLNRIVFSDNPLKLFNALESCRRAYL